jgi:hypothetical protein
LWEAGCDVLQIDEPAMTRYHEKVAAYGARALSTVALKEFMYPPSCISVTVTRAAAASTNMNTPTCLRS